MVTAFNQAITLDDSDTRFGTMKALLDAGLRGQVLDEHLFVLVDQDKTEIRFPSLLLEHGASVDANDYRSIMVAATRQKLEILQLLWTYVQWPEVANVAFQQCMDAGLIEAQAIGIFQFLLEMGAKGSFLDHALQIAVHNAMRDDSKLMALLLSHGANVNSGDARSISYACQTGQLDLLNLLIKSNSTLKARAKGMFSLLRSDPATVSSPDFCLIADILTQRQAWDGKRIIRSYVPQKDDSLLRELLLRRPKGVSELNKLLKAGVNPAGADLLFWAMTTTPRIKTECVEVLVEHGANVHYISHSETMIMVAIRTGRDRLIKTLICRWADPSAHDSKRRSALLLAIEKGTQVRDLLNAAPNDGSLHQAARNLSPNVVQNLLEHGHDPMLPSPFRGHGGRTPLAELLSVSVDPSKYRLFEQVIDSLVSKGADLSKSFARKPLIYLALDNSIDATEALLRIMHKKIDEDFNLYKDDAYCYSPKMYALKTQANQPREKMELLCKFGAERPVFYALSGPQPHDAVGMPSGVKRAELERKEKLKREAEAEVRHQSEIRRTKELAARHEQVESLQHGQALARITASEQHSQRLLQDKHRLQIRLDRERWDAEEQQELKKECTRQTERCQIEAHHQSLAQIETRMKGQTYALEQSHHQQILHQEQQASEAKLNSQKSYTSFVESQHVQRHKRKMKELTIEKAMPVGGSMLEGSSNAGSSGQRFIEL